MGKTKRAIMLSPSEKGQAVVVKKYQEKIRAIAYKLELEASALLFGFRVYLAEAEKELGSLGIDFRVELKKSAEAKALGDMLFPNTQKRARRKSAAPSKRSHP